MNRFFRMIPGAAVLLLVFSSAFWAGCSKDEPPGDGPELNRIEIKAIIVNPLSPTPGSTAELTAQAEGIGDAGTYEWQVSGGTIEENGKISVTWTVPDGDNIYRIFVRGSSGSAVDTFSTYVMSRHIEVLNTGLRYALYPNLINGTLYYVGVNKNPTDRDFLGYHAYRFVLPPSPIDKLTPPPSVDGSYEFTFSTAGLLTGSITDGASYMRQQPMNVILFPLEAGSPVLVSENEIYGYVFRKNQNHYPSASSAYDMYTWQYVKVGARDDGTEDFVNIRLRVGSGVIQTLTSSRDSVFQYGNWMYKYYRNIKPVFTPDDAAIIYFNDSTGTLEPCIIPMVGTTPDLGGRRAFIPPGANHGIFFNAKVQVSEGTVFQWNPVVPTQLAFIDNNRKFCIFDYLAGSVQVVATGVDEFVYSLDGKLAGITDEGVYVLEPGQTEARPVFLKERSSDGLIGVNWSPGTENQRLGFRLVRKGASSIESFSALVIYFMDDDRWYYVSGEIRPTPGTELTVNYIWKRVLFDPASDAMYAPVPLSTSGGQMVLYRSY